MIIDLILIGIVIYVVALLFSFTFSCGGYSFKECGLCPVGLIQLPLELIDRLIDRLRVNDES